MIPGALKWIIEMSCYLLAIYFFCAGKLTGKMWQYVSTIIACGLFAFSDMHYNGSVILNSCILAGQIFLIIWLVEGRIKERVKYALFSYMLISLVNIITSVFLLGRFELPAVYSWLLNMVSIVALGVIFRRKHYKWEISAKSCIILVVGVFFLAGLVAFYLAFGDSSRKDFMVLDIIVLFVFASYVVIIVRLLTSETARALQKEKLEMTLKYQKLQKNYYETINANHERLRRYKHDSNHHLNSVSFLLEENKIGEAKQYLKKISEQLSEINKTKQYCDNNIVDAVLNQIIPQCEKAEISFHLQYNVVGEILMDAVDLSIVLYNLLHNALEAAAKCDNHKKIDMNMQSLENNLFISVENSCQDMLDFRNIEDSKTGKKDRENHGYGLKNIRETVEKYQGEIDYQWKNNCVIAAITIFQIIK